MDEALKLIIDSINGGELNPSKVLAPISKAFPNKKGKRGLSPYQFKTQITKALTIMFKIKNEKNPSVEDLAKVWAWVIVLYFDPIGGVDLELVKQDLSIDELYDKYMLTNPDNSETIRSIVESRKPKIKITTEIL